MLPGTRCSLKNIKSCKEVEDIAQLVAAGTVHFGVGAVATGNGRKFLVLHIKYFGQKAACGSKLVDVWLVVAALGTGIMQFIHGQNFEKFS